MARHPMDEHCGTAEKLALFAIMTILFLILLLC